MKFRVGDRVTTKSNISNSTYVVTDIVLHVIYLDNTDVKWLENELELVERFKEPSQWAALDKILESFQ